MIVYAESSAVLAWLLGEPSQAFVLQQLRAADRVVSSSITAVECARGLSRARAANRIRKSDELVALRLLDVAEAAWNVHDLSERIMVRARLPFPVEPVRTLDALHLATALVFHEAFGELYMLSFDDRMRANASSLGIEVLGLPDPGSGSTS